MSQQQAADRLEISQGHLSKVLAGRAPISRGLAARMAGALNDHGHQEYGRLIRDVQRGLQRSKPFRALVVAGLALVRK